MYAAWNGLIALAMKEQPNGWVKLYKAICKTLENTIIKTENTIIKTENTFWCNADTSWCSERLPCLTSWFSTNFMTKWYPALPFFFIQPRCVFQPLSCTLYSQSSNYFIFKKKILLLFFLHLRGFSYLYIYSVTSPLWQWEGFKGHGKVERAGWVRGFEFTQRVEDCIFPKKTGAAIWVEVMDISMHADRIGGSVGGERPLKTKWTKSSWFECSSAYTLPNVL